jgi:hypothetical protein
MAVVLWPVALAVCSYEGSRKIVAGSTLRRRNAADANERISRQTEVMAKKMGI